MQKVVYVIPIECAEITIFMGWWCEKFKIGNIESLNDIIGNVSPIQ